AGVRHAEVVRVHDDARTGRDAGVVARGDDTGEVDARDERRDARDAALRDGRERVLVVDARPLDPHGDVARGELRLVQRADAPRDGSVVTLLGDERTKAQLDDTSALGAFGAG